MPRKKKTDIYEKMNVLMYDSKNIIYYHGVLTSFSLQPNYVEYSPMDAFSLQNIVTSHSVYLETPAIEELNNIELDKTTMERIAKYNKTQECKRLDKEIEKKENRIKELDNLLQDKEKRWNKVKQYIKQVYEIENIDDLDDDDYDDWED